MIMVMKLNYYKKQMIFFNLLSTHCVPMSVGGVEMMVLECTI